MTVHVNTGYLVDLLGDLLITADNEGPLASVLLHSARGYAGDEPGKTALLVGSSTNRFLAGHTWVPASGQGEPMLWPADDARAVIAVFGPLGKKSSDHTVELRREGDEVVVAEGEHLFGEGTQFKFTLASLDHYPRVLWQLLTEVPVDVGQQPARTDFTGPVLDRLAKLAKRHKDAVQTYRYKPKGAVLVQIGERWRGLAMPAGWDDEVRGAGDEPDADVYPPELPPAPETPPAHPAYDEPLVTT